MIQEILRYSPDVICLQEVDHPRLLLKALQSVGYTGQFVQKPDSPCIYMKERNHRRNIYGEIKSKCYVQIKVIHLINKSSKCKH